MSKLNARIKNKRWVEKMLAEEGISLDSEDMVDAYVTFRAETHPEDGRVFVEVSGYPSYYEKEEITTYKDVVNYIWKERKRFIPTMAQNIRAEAGVYDW